MEIATYSRRTLHGASPDYASQFLDRTRRLIDEEALSALRGSSLLVAGCGGVGGAVALTLARLGVGRFILADPGAFDAPDANRQWAADTASLGRNKAQVYAEWLRRINPESQAGVHPNGVTEANLHALVNQADLVIDCLDISVDLSLRARLYALARARGLYCISAPVLGFGALVVTASPQGVPMDLFVQLLERVGKTGRLPRAFRKYFAATSLDAIDRDIAGGKVPSLAIGPCLAGALASTEALLCLLAKGGRGPRKPLSLPRVLAMDALTMSCRIVAIEEFAS